MQIFDQVGFNIYGCDMNTRIGGWIDLITNLCTQWQVSVD